MAERFPFRFVNESGTTINAKVFLGDMDIASSVSRVEFDAGVGDMPTVVLTLSLIRGAELDLAGAIVRVAPENHDLLVKLGWTPPLVPAGDEGDEHSW